jgi:hypothetical protein
MPSEPKQPPSDADQLPEAEADERFRRGIANALATPPKPHKKSDAVHQKRGAKATEAR